MLLRCPSCGESFEIAEAALAVKATHPCAHCHRVVVIRDAHVVPAAGEVTVPFESGSQDPLTAKAGDDAATRVTGTALPEGKRASLAILSGARQGEVVALRVPRFLIGRDGGGADLELGDPDVSKRHASLEYGGEGFVLRDLDSRTGTWIGEERVERRVLEDRAEFRLGGVRLLFILSG
jgi:pSer/pThr/pTyr-binding forkhead associated (FHA) protein